MKCHLDKTASWHLVEDSLVNGNLKASFYLVVAARDCLTTGERLFKWDFGGDVLCVFCRICIEGRNHFSFFFNVASAKEYGWEI